MAMRAFIIALFVLHGQATLLESGDDDYYADPDGKPIAVQVANSKREDKLGLDIYTKLVSGKSDASCPSLKHWVSAYANDKTVWKSEDKANPEFPKDMEIQNALNAKLRANINKIVQKPNLKCHEIWHLVSCPFTGIRFLAPYEFVFKKPGGWSHKAGILDGAAENATGAYNKVKCGDATLQCTKHSGAQVQTLFKDDKGRTGVDMIGKTGPKMIFNRMIGGIAGSPVMNSGEIGETSADLKTFWAGSEQQKIFSDDTVKLFTGPEQKIVFASVGHGAPPQGHMPAKGASAGFKSVVTHFEKCGVPWIGGVSGSVLEMFAYARYKGTPINDVFVLQWMSLYVLGGFHSMGEVWSALKPMLEAFGLTKTKELSIMGVPAPLSLKDGCGDPKKGNEKLFLDALEKVFETVSV